MFEEPSLSLGGQIQLTGNMLGMPTKMRRHVKVRVPCQKDSKGREDLGFGLRPSRLFICWKIESSDKEEKNLRTIWMCFIALLRADKKLQTAAVRKN